MTQAPIWSVPLTSPATPSAYSQRLDNSLNALRSSHKGALVPSYAVDGMVWVDDSYNIYIQENSTSVLLGAVSTTTHKFLPSMERVSEILASLIPAGACLPYFGSSVPSTDWALPYGQTLNIADFPVIGALFGTDYGGDGVTTFGMPDLRGRVVIGKDDMGGVAAGRVTNSGTGNPGIDGATLGATGGADRITITTAQVPVHNHGPGSLSFSTTSSPGNHVHASASGRVPSAFGAQYLSDGNDFSSGSAPSVLGAGAHTHSGTLNGGTTANAGSGEAHPNCMPAIVGNILMKVH